jgi:hypothetical protein
VNELPGIGWKFSKLLAQKNIKVCGDLLQYSKVLICASPQTFAALASTGIWEKNGRNFIQLCQRN